MPHPPFIISSPNRRFPTIRASAAGDSVAPGKAEYMKITLWFLCVPAGVTKNAWQLIATFLGTIVGIITQPLLLGAVALLGLSVSVRTKTLTFAATFLGFGDPTPWLIALTFFFAKGFIKIGLDNHVAYQFVSFSVAPR